MTTAPRLVRRHDLVLLGEGVELLLPRDAAIAEVPMEDDEWWPGAGPLIGDADAVDLDLVHVARRRPDPPHAS